MGRRFDWEGGCGGVGVDAGVDDAGGGCDAGEGFGKDGAGEAGVYEQGVGLGGAVAFEKVKGEAVEGFERGGARGEQLVGEVAVEEDLCGGVEEAEEGDGDGELVDEDYVWGGDAGVECVRGVEGCGGVKRGRGVGGDGEREVQLAEDGAEDEEAVQQVRGDDCVAADVDGERTVFHFIEAVALVAVGREDGNLVPEVLQPDSSIDNQPLRAADAEVGVDEPDVERVRRLRRGHRAALLLVECEQRTPKQLEPVTAPG